MDPLVANSKTLVALSRQAVEHTLAGIRASRLAILSSEQAIRRSRALMQQGMASERAAPGRRWLYDGPMSEPLKILSAGRLNEHSVVVGFSDGTAAEYTVEQLADLVPERARTVYQESDKASHKSEDAASG